jgi:ATP-dependent DNA ligase
MLAYKDGGAVRRVSRRGVDHTARFGDIAAAVRKAASKSQRRKHEAAPDDHVLNEPTR